MLPPVLIPLSHALSSAPGWLDETVGAFPRSRYGMSAVAKTRVVLGHVLVDRGAILVTSGPVVSVPTVWPVGDEVGGGLVGILDVRLGGEVTGTVDEFDQLQFAHAPTIDRSRLDVTYLHQIPSVRHFREQGGTVIGFDLTNAVNASECCGRGEAVLPLTICAGAATNYRL